MRKITAHIILTICASLAINELRAQQLTHWTYFTYNYLQYNPAAAGTTPCLDLKLGYRRQWRGLSGAPQTAFANVHGKIPPKKHNFLGFGATMENDNAGPFSYTNMYLMASYHMRMAKKYYLSAGLGVGFSQYHVNFGDMFMEQQDIDPVITGNYNNFVFPLMSGGLWLYRDDRYFGMSARAINSPDLTGLGASKLSAHWTFAHGRAIDLSKELVFKPAFLLNYVARSRSSLEGQFMLEYKQKLSLGLGARSGHGFAGLLKIAALKYVTFAYSYDLTVNKIKYGGQSTHELIIGIRACVDKSRYDVPCAAYD
ncbi:MAG: PorP/SprF family type IX secretion system membrane protein [Flavobacteriales bacterium]